MLTSLSLNNFKSWKSIDQMRLAPITGLFGTNSSGKTSIIQSLLLLKQTAASADRAQVLELGGERALTSLGTLGDVLHAHDSAEHLGIGLAWDLPKLLEIRNPERLRSALFSDAEIDFSTEIGCDAKGAPFVRRFSYGFSNHTFEMLRTSESKDNYKLVSQGVPGFTFKRAQGRAWPLPAPVKCYGFPDQVRAYFQNASFLSDFELQLEGLLGSTYYLGPLREHPQRQYSWGGGQPEDVGPAGGRVVEALLAARSQGLTISRGQGRKRRHLDEQVAVWLKDLGLIHSFSIDPIAPGSNLYQVHVRKGPASSDVLLTDVGFGVSQILPVIALCYYVPRGSVVILEQPEIHLHPSVQAGLADVILDAVKVRGIQVILESHSEHLLLRLQRRIAEEAADPDDIALYFCDNVRGQSVLTELDVNLLGQISNWPRDFFGDAFGETAAMTRAGLKRQIVSQG